MLIKIHLEHAEGSRLLLVSHSRMMFTLSLGALAGVVTLFAAVLRLGGEKVLATATPLEIILAATSMALLVCGCLIATNALRAAASAAVDLQANPFWNAEAHLDALLKPDETDEKAVLGNLVRALTQRLEYEKPQRPRTRAIACCLVFGLACACMSLFAQWTPS